MPRTKGLKETSSGKLYTKLCLVKGKGIVPPRRRRDRQRTVQEDASFYFVLFQDFYFVLRFLKMEENCVFLATEDHQKCFTLRVCFF